MTSYSVLCVSISDRNTNSANRTDFQVGLQRVRTLSEAALKANFIYSVYVSTGDFVRQLFPVVTSKDSTALVLPTKQTCLSFLRKGHDIHI